MHKLLTVLFLIASSYFLKAQELTVQTFGDPDHTPLIYLHGGPGYNAVPFERTTATELAAQDFFVVSYDRRGEGRNSNLTADFTFDQTFDDLLKVYKRYGIKKATLIGHSFGGIVATLFSVDHSDRVNEVILVSTPVSMPKTLQNIVTKSKKIYEANNDQTNLNYIQMLEKMDSTSLAYATYSFMHAMSNGFYSTDNPNERAKTLYKKFSSDTLLKQYASKNEYLAPKKFWENEHYTSISIEDNLNQLKKQNIAVYAFYGQDDGLYSNKQVHRLKNILGNNRVKYLENCSHNVFIDRQNEFMNSIRIWVE